MEMDDLFLVLGWGAPIGLGIFLVCLGAMVWLLAKADAISKRAKTMMKETEQNKK